LGDCVRDLGGGRKIAELRREFARFALVAVRQNDALAALYTKDALFFGSAPGLFIVQDGVKTYFSKLPKSVFKSAAFSDQHVIRPSSGVIVAAGFVTFAHEMNGQTSQLPFRITLTMVHQGRDWTIAAYHASPKGT